jgi:NTP pyrophosphatase (non-canonical NTP hydrolase)
MDSDSMDKLETLKAKLQTFADDRDWDQFHSPKNLSMALSVEASELVECFQWLTEEQSKDLSPKQYQAVVDEMADVQVYLLRLATKLDVNMVEAVEQKMAKNSAKYPADLVKGSTKKYTEYEQNITQENSDDAIKP